MPPSDPLIRSRPRNQSGHRRGSSHGTRLHLGMLSSTNRGHVYLPRGGHSRFRPLVYSRGGSSRPRASASRSQSNSKAYGGTSTTPYSYKQTNLFDFKVRGPALPGSFVSTEGIQAYHGTLPEPMVPAYKYTQGPQYNPLPRRDQDPYYDTAVAARPAKGNPHTLTSDQEPPSTENPILPPSPGRLPLDPWRTPNPWLWGSNIHHRGIGVMGCPPPPQPPRADLLREPVSPPVPLANPFTGTDSDTGAPVQPQAVPCQQQVFLYEQQVVPYQQRTALYQQQPDSYQHQAYSNQHLTLQDCYQQAERFPHHNQPTFRQNQSDFYHNQPTFRQNQSDFYHNQQHPGQPFNDINYTACHHQISCDPENLHHCRDLPLPLTELGW